MAFPKDFDQSEYITSLFSAKWADGKCLICKVGKYYVISIGILCQNIQTPRGNLQLSVGIVSTKPIFTRQQHEFLIDIQNRISVAKSVDYNQINEDAKRCNVISDSPVTISDLHGFFSNQNVVCKTFLHSPEILLDLWKARLCRIKISIANTTDIYISSYLSYFIASSTVSHRSTEECAFHIELSQMQELTDVSLRVFAITHPVLMSNDRSPVSLKSNNELYIDDNYKWLKKGTGRILNQLKEALSTNNDINVINVLYNSSYVLSTWIHKSSIQKSELATANLNSSCIPFIKHFLIAEDSPAEFSDSGCC